MLEVAALDGIGHLVGLFEGVRHDARVGLLQVPRAAMLGVAQTGHQVQQVVELVHGNFRLKISTAASQPRPLQKQDIHTEH
ncbi:hypothetical protein D9M68_821530 [compost metagenome]